MKRADRPKLILPKYNGTKLPRSLLSSELLIVPESSTSAERPLMSSLLCTAEAPAHCHQGTLG